jgi:hypothetical protein
LLNKNLKMMGSEPEIYNIGIFFVYIIMWYFLLLSY